MNWPRPCVNRPRATSWLVKPWLRTRDLVSLLPEPHLGAFAVWTIPYEHRHLFTVMRWCAHIEHPPGPCIPSRTQVANAAVNSAQIDDMRRELGALRAEIQSSRFSTEAPTGRRLFSYAPLYTSWRRLLFPFPPTVSSPLRTRCGVTRTRSPSYGDGGVAPNGRAHPSPVPENTN